MFIHLPSVRLLENNWKRILGAMCFDFDQIKISGKFPPARESTACLKSQPLLADGKWPWNRSQSRCLMSNQSLGIHSLLQIKLFSCLLSLPNSLPCEIWTHQQMASVLCSTAGRANATAATRTGKFNILHIFIMLQRLYNAEVLSMAVKIII